MKWWMGMLLMAWAVMAQAQDATASEKQPLLRDIHVLQLNVPESDAHRQMSTPAQPLIEARPRPDLDALQQPKDISREVETALGIGAALLR